MSFLIGGIGRAHEGRRVPDVERELTVGRAMLNVARRGWPTPILEQRDIAQAARADSG